MAKRGPAHTQAEWDKVKPEFINLYVQQGKKLKEVTKILEARGFVASMKQYKSKITEWKMGKYLKERELLHAARKLKEAENRGKVVKIRIRRQSVTMDDVMKHFIRKSMDEEDLLSRLPVSPTPSGISCSTVTDEDNQDQIQQSAAPSTPYSSRQVTMIATNVGTTELEVALHAMRVLAQASVDITRAALPGSLRMPSKIVRDLTHAQYYLNVGQNLQACDSYDKALSELQHSEGLSCMSVLQLIMHLFTWSMYENTTTLTKAVLDYLAEEDLPSISPTLLAVARALHKTDDSEPLLKILYQQILCDIFERGLEPQSPMLFWARIKLCRSLCLNGQLEAAQKLLKHIEHTRTSTRHQHRSFLRYEIDREIAATLHLLGDYQAAKHYLDGVLDHYLSKNDRYGGRLAYTLQQLAACNAQLKLYATAHTQAMEAAKSFAAIHGGHDSNVALSLQLATRIESSLSCLDVPSMSEPSMENEYVSEIASSTDNFQASAGLSSDWPLPNYINPLNFETAKYLPDKIPSDNQKIGLLECKQSNCVARDRIQHKKVGMRCALRMMQEAFPFRQRCETLPRTYYDMSASTVTFRNDFASRRGHNPYEPPKTYLTHDLRCNEDLTSDYAEFDYFAAGTTVSLSLGPDIADDTISQSQEPSYPSVDRRKRFRCGGIRVNVQSGRRRPLMCKQRFPASNWFYRLHSVQGQEGHEWAKACHGSGLDPLQQSSQVIFGECNRAGEKAIKLPPQASNSAGPQWW